MRLLTIAMVFLTGFMSLAQDNADTDKFRPFFSLKFGVNAVDNSGKQEVFNTYSDLKTAAFTTPYALGADYRFSKLFSAGLFASINKWEAGDIMDGFILGDGQEVDYFSVDLGLKIYIDELLFGFTNDPQNGWLDLYVGAGGSYFSIEDSRLSANLSAGANIWLTDHLGLNFEAIAKVSGEEVRKSNHYQYFAGIAYRIKDNDLDNDGVKNNEDQCPNTFGLAEFNGCPDTDGDGLIDKDDNCPNEAGTVNGCPDSDNDGIADAEDNCSNAEGPAENNGCPWPDSDGDGVLDKDDNCPNEWGTDNGCPKEETLVNNIITDAEKGEITVLSRSVLFDINSEKLTPKSIAVLNQILVELKPHPNMKLHIIGHTDATASEAYNKKLSISRADVVKNYLKNGGLLNTITTEGAGEKNPIASNLTAQGKAKNRRIELFFKE